KLQGQVRPDLKTVIRTDRRKREEQRRCFNKRHRARELRTLKVGDKVWVNDRKSEATVVARAAKPRSYLLETDSGRQLRRNRRALHFLPSGSSHQNGGSYDFPEGDEEDTDSSDKSLDGSTRSNVVVGPASGAARVPQAYV
ncbi:unnamed protein product, partial [Ixodes pacificus]